MKYLGLWSPALRKFFKKICKSQGKSFPEAELLINATLALILSSSSFLRRTLHLLQIDLI